MKRILAAFLLFSVFGVCQVVGMPAANAQFRQDARREAERQPENTLGTMTSEGGLLSRIFDPARLSSHQTYSFSYSSLGSQSVGLGVFTNTFSYKASDDMYISADLSAVYSPFNTFGDAFSKQLNGIYLSNAQLDWRLGENTFLTVQYQGGPLSQNPYSRYDRFSPFYDNGGSMFGSSFGPNPFRGTEIQSSFGTGGWNSQSVTVRH